MERTKDHERVTFSTAEFMADAGRVFAYAEKHGSAVVNGSDGKQSMLISIPTTTLPFYDPTK